jgi:hypothetical protein
MDKGNVNKHRNTYSNGVRAKEEGKHGREMARERYGSLKYENGAPRPKDASAPQAPENQHAPNYRNEVPTDSWLRGGGDGGEGKPSYGRIKRRQG